MLETGQLDLQVRLDVRRRLERKATLRHAIDHLTRRFKDLLVGRRTIATASCVPHHQRGSQRIGFVRHLRAPVARAELPGTGASTAQRSASGQPRVGQPGVHRRAEGLDGDHPALLALLLQRGRDTLENGFARVQEHFARHRQRDAARTIAPEGQRLAAAMEAVVIAEGDGTAGLYRHVHPVPVRSLINL